MVVALLVVTEAGRADLQCGLTGATAETALVATGEIVVTAEQTEAVIGIGAVVASTSVAFSTTIATATETAVGSIAEQSAAAALTGTDA